MLDCLHCKFVSIYVFEVEMCLLNVAGIDQPRNNQVIRVPS